MADKTNGKHRLELKAVRQTTGIHHATEKSKNTKISQRA
jgi:hypothetical protein